MSKVLTSPERLEIIGFLRECQRERSVVRLVDKHGEVRASQDVLPVDVSPYKIDPNEDYWHYVDANGEYMRSPSRFVAKVQKALRLTISPTVATKLLKTVCGTPLINKGASQGLELGVGLVYVGEVTLSPDDVQLIRSLDSVEEVFEAVKDYVAREQYVLPQHRDRSRRIKAF